MDAIVVIAVGRICAQKNFEAAIDAIAILARKPCAKTLRYLFCGEGLDKVRLETRAREFGINACVQFLGNRTDIPALLEASDVFLSTSLYEGMPLTVLEALHAGLRCVLSSIDEHYEIAKTMPGCRFAPPNHPEEIAMALEAAVSESIWPSDLKHARATLLEKFSIEKCVASYLSLYQSLCHVERREMYAARECK
jgi:glycosyltransferase involved in cell wall biosynthesis